MGGVVRDGVFIGRIRGGLGVIQALLCLAVTLLSIHPITVNAEQSHLAWSSLEQPKSMSFSSIVGVVNLDTLFLTDEDLNLVAREGESFQQLPSLTTDPYSHVVTHFDQGRYLFATVLDSGYGSESFLWKGDSWESLGLKHDVPVRLFTYGPDGSLYAVGDWGTLFRRKPDKDWELLKSPSSQHLLALLVTGADDIWIGTRGEGIYHLHNGDVDHYSSPVTDYVDVYELAPMLDGTITFRAGAGAQYAIVGQKIVPIERASGIDQAYFMRCLDEESELYQTLQFMLVKTDQNLDRIVFRDERIRQVRFLDEGQALALDMDGHLLRGDRQHGLFFHDATNRYRLAGYPAETVQAAMFNDITGDGTLELSVLVQGSAPGLHIYAREREAGFLEITGQTGLPAMPGATHIVPGDFNRDGWTDLILTSLTQDGLHLYKFNNLGHGFFGRPVRIDQKLAQVDRPSDLVPLDWDGDGDLDLLSVEYYGPREQRRGGVSYFDNHRSGRLLQAEDLNESMLGFNLHALPMDYNQDGMLDILLSTRWISDKLFLGTAEGFRLADSSSLPDGQQKTNREGSVALDIDQDGDLDLFMINHLNGCELWENDGEGHFLDRTAEWLPSCGDAPFSPTIKSAAAVDIDLDGDVDLLLAAARDRDNDLVYLENHNGRLIEIASSIGLDEESPEFVLPVDIDSDGDLDLYMAGAKENRLFLNRTDRKDWLIVRPHGRGSNPDGYHAIVDLFPRGGQSDSVQLRIRRGWVGGHLFARTPYTMLAPDEVLFGAVSGPTVDVRVTFYGGQVVWKRDVPAGQILDVHETVSLTSISYPWSGRFLNQLGRREVQRFLIIFLVASVWLIGVVQFGRRRLKWGILWVSSLVTINQAAFWTVTILAARSNHPLRFVAPVGFVVIGTIIPLLASWSWRRLKQSDVQRQSQQLLKHLLVFNHGEWALNNLNSLQRLVPHYLQATERSTELTEQCQDRISTWQDMTAPNLAQLIEAGRHLSTKTVVLKALQDDVRMLQRQVDDFAARLKGEERDLDPDRFVDTIQALRGGLKQLKTHVYREHSCDAIAVVQNLHSLLNETKQLNGVSLHKEFGREQMWVLLPSYVLADVLDNLLRNALKAMTGVENGQIEIKAKSMGAKCHLFITDNGCGVDHEEVDTIFLEGITHGGSGHGLAQARDVLKLYGGGIHLHWSEKGKGATFRLDLNEGVKRSESDAADHRR